jgi:hypothetical protein
VPLCHTRAECHLTVNSYRDAILSKNMRRRAVTCNQQLYIITAGWRSRTVAQRYHPCSLRPRFSPAFTPTHLRFTSSSPQPARALPRAARYACCNRLPRCAPRRRPPCHVVVRGRHAGPTPAGGQRLGRLPLQGRRRSRLHPLDADLRRLRHPRRCLRNRQVHGSARYVLFCCNPLNYTRARRHISSPYRRPRS